MRQSSLILELQSIVVRREAIPREHDRSEVWIKCAHIHLGLLEQSPACRTEIGKGECVGCTERLLYADVPLQSVGQLEMGRVRIRIARPVRRERRVQDRRDDLRHAQRKTCWRRSNRGGRQARPLVSARSVLLTCVKKDPASAPNDCFEARPIPQDIGYPHPRSVVVPSRFPKRRTLWRKRKRAVPYGRVRQIALGRTRCWIYFPSHAHRQSQRGRDFPLVLSKSREIQVHGKCSCG